MLSLLFPSTLGAFPVMLIKCFSFSFCHLGQVAAKSIKTRGWKGEATMEGYSHSSQVQKELSWKETLSHLWNRDPLPLRSSPTLLRLLSHWSLNRKLFGELLSHSGLNLNQFLLPLPKILPFFFLSFVFSVVVSFVLLSLRREVVFFSPLLHFIWKCGFQGQQPTQQLPLRIEIWLEFMEEI